jgi:hypothetical protein
MVSLVPAKEWSFTVSVVSIGVMKRWTFLADVAETMAPEEDEDRGVDAPCPHRELQHRMGLTFH